MDEVQREQHRIVEEQPAVESTGDINLKDVCVFESLNKYPDTIPKERGSSVRIICILITCILFLVDINTNENRTTTVLALYMISILINIGLQILYRSILVLEEIRHIISRYEGNYLVLLKDAYHFPTNVFTIAVIAVIYNVYYYFSNNNIFTDYQPNWQISLLIPSIYLLGVVLQLDSSPLNDSLWVAKNNGLDYGSGMAYSFFHGYLKLILPKTGTQEKNLKELMQDYEDQNDIKFSAYKLFILIPKSLICFVSLKNEHSPSVDESSSLSEKQITVAGVQNRVYKNAVYKICSEKNPVYGSCICGADKIYVSAEYATPLRTFKNVVDSSGVHRGYYDKHKNDIILQFYLTLKKVLQRKGLSEFCELIYYDDSYQGEDNQTHYYDVGKILLTRLKQLKKLQKKLLREKIE